MTKCVLRVLDAAGQLLGWTEHQALVRGDGVLRTSAAVRLRMDTAGWATTLSVHWCAVNVEVRVPLSLASGVTAGQMVDVVPAHHPLIVVGPAATGLPPVTVGHAVSVSVPTGGLGASGGR